MPIRGPRQPWTFMLCAHHSPDEMKPSLTDGGLRGHQGPTLLGPALPGTRAPLPRPGEDLVPRSRGVRRQGRPAFQGTQWKGNCHSSHSGLVTSGWTRAGCQRPWEMPKTLKAHAGRAVASPGRCESRACPGTFSRLRPSSSDCECRVYKRTFSMSRFSPVFYARRSRAGAVLYAAATVSTCMWGPCGRCPRGSGTGAPSAGEAALKAGARSAPIGESTVHL